MTQNPIETRPNILIIRTDQHRYDCVGHADRYPVQTPHLDKLASEGMWFEHAFTPIAICCPSRQAFLTGKRPESFGALWNYDLGLPTGHIAHDAWAYPREMQKHGYRTAHIGKWHIHPSAGPKSFGYDSELPMSTYTKYRKECWPNHQTDGGIFGGVDPVPLEESRTHWLAARAAEKISELTQGDQPWHLHVDFPEPHLPSHPSQEYMHRFPPESIPQWGGFADTFRDKPYMQRQHQAIWGVQGWTWEDWAPIVARYYAVVAQIDDAIGTILRQLEQSGAADDTVVIYTTDHGDMGGSHGMVDKHYCMYDDILRVPLIVRWPGRVAAGSRCSDFVKNALDLPPTLLQIAGSRVPPGLHGHSMASLLDGTTPPDWPQEAVSTYNGQQFGLYTCRSIRTVDWKYVWNTSDVDELYDIQNDPHELTNRIHDPSAAEIVAELRIRLYHRLHEFGDRLVANEWMKQSLVEGRKA